MSNSICFSSPTSLMDRCSNCPGVVLMLITHVGILLLNTHPFPYLHSPPYPALLLQHLLVKCISMLPGPRSCKITELQDHSLPENTFYVILSKHTNDDCFKLWKGAPLSVTVTVTPSINLLSPHWVGKKELPHRPLNSSKFCSSPSFPLPFLPDGIVNLVGPFLHDLRISMNFIYIETEDYSKYKQLNRAQ